MDDDLPIPRGGKVEGWKLPSGVQKTGDPETPDACPFCSTTVLPVPGMMLGQASVGEEGSPEPWQETAECPECHSGLRRVPGDPWIGMSA
jgi:hypothetical protein